MIEDYKTDTCTVEELIASHPYVREFFAMNNLPMENGYRTIASYFATLPYTLLEDLGTQPPVLLGRFHAFMREMANIRERQGVDIKSLTIRGGRDKRGNVEDIELRIGLGDLVSIVGPTGSGKSRLLADIEWMAQRDTPTGRQILVDDEIPPASWRFSSDHKLVAQLSQNMNFVMDVSVAEFLVLHAQSRMIDHYDQKIAEIIRAANGLSGEAFELDAPLTSLSGGQARALMVADTAFLSVSPIVLIDEIENAGINRTKALALLSGQNKMVLIATHDPLLALSAPKRIVVCNGGIMAVLDTSDEERQCLRQLQAMDDIQTVYRDTLRSGDSLRMCRDRACGGFHI